MHGVLLSLAEIASKAGITDVVICPGSRSAPLVLAFVRHGAFRTHVFSDERSAAFIALGIAQRTGRPVVLICTSGSAAYNFAPAVAEAFFQQIPLVVLTADRPKEWIDQLDGQTIRQTNLFAGHAKRAWELNADYTHQDSAWYAQRVFNEAIYTAFEAPNGPVHVNFPFREPLYPETGEHHHTQPFRHIAIQPPALSIAPEPLAALAAQIKEAKKILIVVGQGNYSSATLAAVQLFSRHHGAVIVGDILSNFHGCEDTIRLADGFLGAIDTQKKSALAPDLLITFGLSVISKNLKLFLRAHRPNQHWHLQPSGVAPDTFQSLTRIIRTTPQWFFHQFQHESAHTERSEFQLQWQGLETACEAATRNFLAPPTDSEFFVVNEFLRHLPDNATLHLSNSMPVRYVNYIGLAPNRNVQVYANRGTSGIDGCTSTAVGHALADASRQVLLTGDVAFFYDSNAFWHSKSLPNLRIVLLNNHGGVIFKLIDGPGDLPEMSQYFVTEQKRSAQALCAEFGIRYIRYAPGIAWADFFSGDGPALLEVVSTPEQNKLYFTQFKQHLKSSI